MKVINIEFTQSEIDEMITALVKRQMATKRFTREPLNYPPSWVKSALDEQELIKVLLQKLAWHKY